jgi:hypothetical protein
MSEPLKIQSPHGSPDSLRAMLQSFKQFYEMHTKLDYGYSDVDGLQYVGSIHNFGPELLLESRKLRMTKPAVDIIRPNEYMSYYFDISHSDYINTYDQQNMLMLCVKPNTMYAPHTYQLYFRDTDVVGEVIVLRADGYSEENVRASKFLRVINPKLVIDGDFINKSHILYTGENQYNIGPHSYWYIPLDRLHDGFYHWETVDDVERFVSIDMRGYDGLPFLFLCETEMRLLPEVNWTGNVDGNNHPILTNGTNGHDQNLMYPLVYGYDNLPFINGESVPFDPTHDYETNGYWYFRIEGDFSYRPGRPVLERDAEAKIFKVQIVHCQTPSFTEQPDFVQDITYDDDHLKVTLAPYWKGKGIYRVPSKTDWDFNPTRYGNIAVACIPLHLFKDNVETLEHHEIVYKALLQLKFDEGYFNPYESQANQMRVGMHVDYTANKSLNGVEKKYGIAYRLAEFDGLPMFYRTTRVTDPRARLEIYAIRDDANDRNQKPMDKQTAAIILDSGIPQNYSNQVTPDMASSIVFDWSSASIMHRYITDFNVATGTENEISDTVFINGNHFADRYAEDCYNYPRFVYHGNRHFSLSLVRMNPDTEYGRGYLLSNDPVAYINNALETVHQKAERTVARICDIPTSYEQLQHVTYISPTIVVDPYYIRQYAPYTPELRYTIWNDRRSKWYHYRARYMSPYDYSEKYFPSLSYCLETPIRTDDMMDEVGNIPTDMVEWVNINDPDQCTWTISTPGSGYKSEDIVGFHVGGVYLIGSGITVTSAAERGIASLVLSSDPSVPGQYDIGEELYISIACLDGNPCTYDLETRTGSGHGAKITIQVNADIYASNHIPKDGGTILRNIIPDGMYTYYKNETTDGISVMAYDKTTNQWDVNTSAQISGDVDIGNPIYDPRETRKYRTVLNTFLYNILTNKKYEQTFILSKTNGGKTFAFGQDQIQFNPDIGFTIERLLAGFDFKYYVSNFGFNVWNSLFGIVPSHNHNYAYIVRWNYDMESSSVQKNVISDTQAQGNLLFPKRSDLNVCNYDDSYSALKFNVESDQVIPYMYDIMHMTYDSYYWNRSFLEFVGSSRITIPSMIEIRSDIYPSDADPLYSGGIANYNIYRFNNTQNISMTERYRTYMMTMTDEDILESIRTKLGDDALAVEYYNYPELEYLSGTTYLEGGIVKDASTNVTYLATETFVSTTLENDIEYGFLKYVGPSYKKESMINYYIQNLFTGEHMYNTTDVSVFKAKGVNILADYIPLNSKPYDWEENCSKYYQLIDSEYVHVSMISAFVSVAGDVAPPWKPYTYYAYINNEYVMLEDEPYRWVVDYNKYYMKQYVAPQFVIGMYYESQLENAPFGAYVPVMETYHTETTVGNVTKHAYPLYVMRLDDQSLSVDDFINQYRVYDNDTDISEYVMMIFNNRPYVFHSGKWELHY